MNNLSLKYCCCEYFLEEILVVLFSDFCTIECLQYRRSAPVMMKQHNNYMIVAIRYLLDFITNLTLIKKIEDLLWQG